MKQLNIGEPIIKSFTMYAGPLSLMAPHPRTNNWIFNTFDLLCCFKHDRERLGIFYNPLEIRRYCPWIVYENINKSRITTPIIEFIIESLNQDSAVYLYVDHEHIGQSQLRETHDLFIYGYSEEEKIFYAADNCIQGKYSQIEISFEELKNAYLSEKPNIHSVRDKVELLTFDNNRQSNDFSLLQFKHQITDWINCTCSDPRNDIAQSMLFGLEIYDRFLSYIAFLSKMKVLQYFDMRPFYVLSENKMIMVKRLQYLKEQKILDIPDSIIEGSKVIHNSSEIIRNLSYKLVVGQAWGQLHKVREKLRELQEADEKEKRNLLKLL